MLPILTRAQRKALHRVYLRALADAPELSYLAFRRTVCIGRDCAMVPYAGMWLGIEPDGYTHS